MAHDIHSFIKKEEIHDFIKRNESYYLANIFIPDASKETIEVGLYSKDKDKMKTYTEGNVEESTDIAKTGNEINKLELNKEILSFTDAVKAAKKENEDNKPYKRVLGVLQNSGEPVWTITLITIEYTVYTIKIHAENKDVLSKKESNMMSWVKTA